MWWLRIFCTQPLRGSRPFYRISLLTKTNVRIIESSTIWDRTFLNYEFLFESIDGFSNMPFIAKNSSAKLLLFFHSSVYNIATRNEQSLHNVKSINIQPKAFINDNACTICIYISKIDIIRVTQSLEQASPNLSISKSFIIIVWMSSFLQAYRVFLVAIKTASQNS